MLVMYLAKNIDLKLFIGTFENILTYRHDDPVIYGDASIENY